MSDEEITHYASDPRTISLHEDADIRYWTKELDINAQQLQAVVEAVGPSAGRVREYLQRLQQD
ncbi:MAG: DUF3606 domain-containing protein [Pseudomonadota bacterium]